MKPVGPKEFNPVLGASMAGMATTVSAVTDIIGQISDALYLNGAAGRQCIRILRLSAKTRDRMAQVANGFTRPELQMAKACLIEHADYMHSQYLANFRPDIFVPSARKAMHMGEQPEALEFRWVREIAERPLNLIDAIQSKRTAGREHRGEWKALEEFKQEIVNMWGKEGFLVSRSHGREYNYLMRRFWIGCGKIAGLGAFVMGTLVAIATTWS
jgi:hypothetical protein